MGETAAVPPAGAAGLGFLREEPAFARQWAGYVAAALGSQAGWIALIWLAIRLTGSAATVGVVTLAYVAPQALCAPLAGAVLDRYPRARAMALANLGASLLFAAIAALGGGRGPGAMATLYPLIVLAGALVPFNSAGRIALVAEIVPEGLTARANFVMQGGGQLAILIGPAIGGALVALAGPRPLLWADAATFALQAAALVTVAARRPAAVRPPESGPAALGAGFSYVLARPALIAFALMEVLFNFLYGPFEVLLPDMAKSALGGAWALGAMWSAFGVGSVAAALVFAARPWPLRPSRSFPLIVILWALVALTMSRVGGIVEACAVMLVGGAIYSPWAAVYATVLQTAVPTRLQARVAGALSALITGGMPAGALCAGLVLSAVPGRTVFALSGAATLALGLAVLALPALRGLDAKAGA